MDKNIKKNNLQIKGFFDKLTSTISYVVYDKFSKECAVIDSVLDFDYSSGSIDYLNAENIISFIEKNNLSLIWLIETHVHADHLSAAPYIQKKLGGQIGISEKISDVQNIFGKTFNAGTEFQRDGSQFDKLFKNNDEYQIGQISCKVIDTPGHTPACTAHIISDSIFVGDTLFMPDLGSARADFPGGDARTLYKSIKKILSYPDNFNIFVCHDYPPSNREAKWSTTVGEQKKNNIHVKDTISEDEFVRIRETRDKTLNMPNLIIPSIQVNMRAGNLPPSEDNGDVYLKIPINSMKNLV
ncbi:MBL fold metallo-hydrolase [Alphaproteobacteria bacterium]|jgi:glyoxylase-like metal-dependent hydrolase (beta-lactamase superfamily II)|nr:MBL fold metallo-hydrolase [Alphaproteobacteria bacterium]MDB2684197.1 MBL fold metallo-hydrolase [Alphaproteobacteria bacterium]MDB3916330.1 MBL fold metallo-hydrolase [Alphaproteobacteria bacterium]